MRCRVGPAESQVAESAAAWLQNRRGLKRRGTITVPPTASWARVEAIRPWTWNSGIAQNDTSSEVSW